MFYMLLGGHHLFKTGLCVLPVALLLGFVMKAVVLVHLLGRENALINYSGLKGVGE